MMFRDAFLSLFHIRYVPAADLQWSQRFIADVVPSDEALLQEA
jgi:hypothetical protein